MTQQELPLETYEKNFMHASFLATPVLTKFTHLSGIQCNLCILHCVLVCVVLFDRDTSCGFALLIIQQLVFELKITRNAKPHAQEFIDTPQVCTCNMYG